MFGRELTAVAPKAGRTDRAIVADTLALAGVPRDELDAFLAALVRVAADGAVPGPVRPLPWSGTRRWTWRLGGPPGPGWWRSRPVAIPRPPWPRPVLMSSCRT